MNKEVIVVPVDGEDRVQDSKETKTSTGYQPRKGSTVPSDFTTWQYTGQASQQHYTYLENRARQDRPWERSELRKVQVRYGQLQKRRTQL